MRRDENKRIGAPFNYKRIGDRKKRVIVIHIERKFADEIPFTLSYCFLLCFYFLLTRTKERAIRPHRKEKPQRLPITLIARIYDADHQGGGLLIISNLLDND